MDTRREELRSEPPSLGSMLGELVQKLTLLVRTEISLLRTELRENLQRTGNGLIFAGVGAALMMAAVVVLLQSLVAWLVAAGLHVGWAALVVGLVVGGIGALLVRSGIARISPANLAPDRTAEQLRKDLEVAKEQVK